MLTDIADAIASEAARDLSASSTRCRAARAIKQLRQVG